MTEIKAEGLDEARAALDDVDQVVAIYGHTMDYGAPSRHLRHALTVADTLAARLAEVEEQLERVRAVGPRWFSREPSRDYATWHLMVGAARLPWSGLVMSPMSIWETETCESHTTLPAAARAVCKRLGLPEILDGLPDGGGK